jgi:FtsH-binding integral membrane protein
MNRLLDWFNDWFSSRAGVIQVFLLSVVAVILEIVFPHVDPNRFWLLFICTVWSFFTQNALAYSSRTSGEEVARRLAAVMELEAEIDSRLTPKE